MKKISAAVLISFIFFCVSPLVSSAQPNAQLESGIKKQKAGSHAEAIEDFTAVIKKNDTEVQKYLKLLADYEKIPAFERADKGIEAPAADAALAQPYYLRGYSYSYSGKNAEAMEDFNTAVKINPKLGAAYFQRGKLLWTTGKKDEGCIDFGMAGSLKDSSAREMFEDKFCWKEAVAAYDNASSKIKLSDFQGVLDVIQPAIKLCPDSAEYLGMRGRAYLGLGKYDLAMLDFDKAIALGQKNFSAYYGRGCAFVSKNKYQEAFDDLSKAIESNEKFADAYMNRAYACEGMQKNQSALYDYLQAQKLRPGDPAAFYKSGLLKNEMNDKIGACKDFKRAAALGSTEAQDYAAQQCK